MFRNTVLILSLWTLSSAPALAMPITVDEILYDSAANPTYLSGTVDMSLSGNTLTIMLTNTSLDLAGSEAPVLLTGLAFSLPGNVSIQSGTVNMGGSTAENFTKPASGDVSGEWGYDNGPLHSGQFKDGAVYAYNTVIASMVSMTTDRFSSTKIENPSDLGGPEFGLVSQSETNVGGQNAIRNSILISLTLAGPVSSNLVSSINNGYVGLSFGSPNSSNLRVPEPASMSLLVGGLAAIGFLRRRQRAA